MISLNSAIFLAIYVFQYRKLIHILFLVFYSQRFWVFVQFALSLSFKLFVFRTIIFTNFSKGKISQFFFPPTYYDQSNWLYRKQDDIYACIIPAFHICIFVFIFLFVNLFNGQFLTLFEIPALLIFLEKLRWTMSKLYLRIRRNRKNMALKLKKKLDLIFYFHIIIVSIVYYFILFSALPLSVTLPLISYYYFIDF